MKHKEQILRLRLEGKSYKQICDILKCSKSTVAYHCGDGQKTKKSQRQIKFKNNSHPYQNKVYMFTNRKQDIVIKNKLKSIIRKQLTDKISSFNRKNRIMSTPFTVEDVINKFGENPKCYITGQSIDIYQPSTYQFDHIIPVSRGGNNSLENLGICITKANLAKNNMTPDELFAFCHQVIKYQAESVGIAPTPV